MYNYDPTGSRYNTAEHTLNPRNVGRLGVLWRVPAAGSVFGTPTVSDGVVYAGDESGVVHAIRTDGAPLWSTRVDGPVTDSILLMRDTLVFGDLNGNIYGLNPRNGEIRWRIRPSPHPIAAIYGSATRWAGTSRSAPRSTPRHQGARSTRPRVAAAPSCWPTRRTDGCSGRPTWSIPPS